jgi:sortase A
MRPQDQSNTPSSRDLAVPARDAAANVVRGQLDALYSGTSSTGARSEPQPAKNQARAQHSSQPAASDNSADHWKQYHSAWQEYYQKYYEHYYTGHVHRMLNEQRQQLQSTTPNAQSIPTGQATSVESLTPAEAPTSNTPVTPANNREAVDQLRQKLIGTVQSSATKVRKSRHFIPIMAAAVVVLLFAFLQYNSVLIGTVQAYVSPGAIDPQNIVVDPTADAKVGPESKLIIPKINVDVPVIYGVANTHDAQMAAMQNGVAHFAIPGANSVPGQIGNTSLSGHSSNDLFEPGDYKFVFAQLDKLQNGDTIYVNYQGTRYSYVVTKKEVVAPSDGQKLVYQTDKPILTLITCTPLGTSTNRLLVTAEQVSPDPTKATPAPGTDGSTGAAMPGNSPSALEKLFGNKG